MQISRTPETMSRFTSQYVREALLVQNFKRGEGNGSCDILRVGRRLPSFANKQNARVEEVRSPGFTCRLTFYPHGFHKSMKEMVRKPSPRNFRDVTPYVITEIQTV